MFNPIKMDLYRMFRMKSLYIIWIVLAAAILFSTYLSWELSKYEPEASQESSYTQEMPQETGDGETEGNSVALGMDIVLPTQPGEEITLFDQIYANLQGKFVALFLLIFTVLFSAADINSGYIKNIGGQVRDRSGLILSRAAALFVFTFLTMALNLIVQIICQRIFFGKLLWGDAAQFWTYMGVQTVLHYALVLIGMALAVILKSNVISMTLCVCLTMNLLVIIYSAIDKVLEKLGADGFHLIEHTVTGKIALFPMEAGVKESLLAVGTAVVFGTLAAALTCGVFRRRDVKGQISGKRKDDLIHLHQLVP